MNGKRWFGSMVIGTGMVLASTSASAQEGHVLEGHAAEGHAAEGHAEGGEHASEYDRLAVSFVERGIVVGKFILNPTVEFAVAHADPDSIIHLGVAARFGITPDLQVQAAIAPLILSPKAAYTVPTIGATYRFVGGKFELGGSLDLGVAVADPESGISFPSPGFVITPQLVSRLHIGEKASLDVNLFASLNTAGNAETVAAGETSAVASMGVPVRFAYDIIEPLHVGVNSGLVVGDFGDVTNTLGIPLGIFAGYAIAGKHGPILDIDPFFGWPSLIVPAASGPGAEAVHSNEWELGLEIGGFLYL